MSLEPIHSNQDSDRTASDHYPHYRLRFHFGDLRLYSQWHPELAPVENLALQLLHGESFHDVTIEAKARYRPHQDASAAVEATTNHSEAQHRFEDTEGQQ